MATGMASIDYMNLGSQQRRDMDEFYDSRSNGDTEFQYGGQNR